MTRLGKIFLFWIFFFTQNAEASPWLQWPDQLLQEAQRSDWPSRCVSDLKWFQYRVDQLDGKVDAQELMQVAVPLRDHLWNLRLALHARLGETSDECVRETRNTFRKLRFIEDLLGEQIERPGDLDPLKMDFKSQPIPIDQSAKGYWLQTRDSKFSLKPGDIILARGISFLSAMIARLGDVESQFSHVVFVTENPQTHALETIESYVGVGVAIYDRATALRNENARLLVLRPKDQKLARRAAQQMRAYVLAHSGAKKIRYDYALDFQDHSTMSCAEVAQFAFWSASGHQFNLPERPSRLSHGLDLLKHLGIKPGPTFTPGDLEGDSRFEMIAEWRDLRLTRDSRLKDAILTKIFEWMDRDGSVLHSSMKSMTAGSLIWELRRTSLWPLVKKTMSLDDFSTEIPRAMLATVALMNQLTEGPMEELRRSDELHEIKTRLPMTYIELYQRLEQIRRRDQKEYANPLTRKNSILLKYLRP